MAALRHPCVAMSSSPQHRSTAGCSVNETIRGSYTKRAATLKAMVTAEDVEDALTNVIDPELGLDFVELGLIYGIDVEGGNVHVTFTLTSPGCPIGPQVTEQIEEFVGELDDVDQVTSSMVFNPPWTPDKMSEDAKFALGF
jgi:metal-sulfur cluster biosynthetic enzyme